MAYVMFRKVGGAPSHILIVILCGEVSISYNGLMHSVYFSRHEHSLAISWYADHKIYISCQQLSYISN